MGWQATVEQVAVNAVMAGAMPEYLPAILAMMSGGPNYSASSWPIGYYQIMSGPYAKEIGVNAGQGSMNPGNPPSMTIGRAFQLCLINLGGATVGSTNTNLGNPINRAELCFAEDNEALPQGWVGMNQDVGFKADESVIMLCQITTGRGGNFAPSSFRALNSGQGGIARRLGVEGTPGYYNFIEYVMQTLIMRNTTSGGTPTTAPGLFLPAPLVFVIHPDMALSLFNTGFKTKAEFYQWVYDRTVTPLSEFKKYGWYDEITNSGTAIEPTSGKPYNELSNDYSVHVMGKAEEQLVIITNFPGDESIQVYSPGRGLSRCIDPWR